MVQFYLLSILLNIVVGVSLFSLENTNDVDGEELNDVPKKIRTKAKSVKTTLENDSIFTNPTFCMISGLLCCLVGIIKLFFVFHVGEHDFSIPVFGDFFPAIAGILGGTSLALSYYADSFEDHNFPAFVENVFLKYRKYIGCINIIVAIIHFIIPGFIFF